MGDEASEQPDARQRKMAVQSHMHSTATIARCPICYVSHIDRRSLDCCTSSASGNAHDATRFQLGRDKTH